MVAKLVLCTTNIYDLKNVQVYAPTIKHMNKEINDNDTVESLEKKSDNTIVMGDFCCERMGDFCCEHIYQNIIQNPSGERNE